MKTKLFLLLLMSILLSACWSASEDSETYGDTDQGIEIQKENPDPTKPFPDREWQLWEVQVQFEKIDTFQFGNFKPKITKSYDSAGPFQIKAKSKPKPKDDGFLSRIQTVTPEGYQFYKLIRLKRLR